MIKTVFLLLVFKLIPVKVNKLQSSIEVPDDASTDKKQFSSSLTSLVSTSAKGADHNTVS